jgi:predicted peroxiredoxin
MKAQHQQVQLDRRQTLTEFIKECQINLKCGKRYDLTDIAVTSDNKLLLCNGASSHHKVQGRVICDNDPIVSMLTFLISLNSMSISLIADDMS